MSFQTSHAPKFVRSHTEVMQRVQVNTQKLKKKRAEIYSPESYTKILYTAQDPAKEKEMDLPS